MDIANALEKAEEQSVYSYRLRKRAKKNIEELKKIFDNWEKIEPKFRRGEKGKILLKDKKELIQSVLGSMWYQHRTGFLDELIVEDMQSLEERKKSSTDYDKRQVDMLQRRRQGI